MGCFLWDCLVGQVVFQQVDEAVGIVEVADGVEVPAVCATLHGGEGHGAGAVRRVAADVVAADFLAFAIQGADVGAAHAGEALSAFAPFVDGDDEEDLPVGVGQGIQIDFDLFGIIARAAAAPVVAGEAHFAAGVGERVVEDDVAAFEGRPPVRPRLAEVAYFAVCIEQEGDGVEVVGGCGRGDVPAEADGEAGKVVARFFAQADALAFLQVDGHGQRTMLSSGGGGGSSSSPLTSLPLSIFWLETEMEELTHWKKLLMEVASAVSSETTVSVMRFRVAVSALGPAAQATKVPVFTPRMAAMPFSRSSVGAPSERRKTTGFQSPLTSALPFTTSRLMQSAKRVSAAPRAVMPLARRSGAWKLISSVSGVSCLASLLKVMTER